MEVGTPATSRSSTVGSATPRRRVAVPSRRLGGAGREAPAFPAGGGGGAIVGTREWPRLECNNEFGVGDRVGPARRSPSRWPVNISRSKQNVLTAQKPKILCLVPSETEK